MGKGVKSDGQKRKRSANFTAEKVTVLTREVEARKHLLYGELKGPHLTQAHRDRAWCAVLEKINAVSPAVRSVQDLKNKFADLKTRTKQKANKIFREAKKTGGGQNAAEALTENEKFLCAFIGKESIEGIRGGGDIGLPMPVCQSPEEGCSFKTLISFTPPLSTRPKDIEDIGEGDIELVVNENPEGDHSYKTITITPPSPFLTEKAYTNTETILEPSVASTFKAKTGTTPKQKKTLKSKVLEVAQETNVGLKNIFEELKTFNKTMKKKLEIEDKLLQLKKTKI